MEMAILGLVFIVLVMTGIRKYQRVMGYSFLKSMFYTMAPIIAALAVIFVIKNVFNVQKGIGFEMVIMFVVIVLWDVIEKKITSK